ncbi:MAG: hypothetical protein ACOCVR_03145 [Myxococcota bacterium]
MTRRIDSRQVPSACFLLLAVVAISCGEDTSEDPVVNAGPTYRALEAASIELDIPPALLMAVASVQSGFEMIHGQALSPHYADSACWGVMGLADDRNLDESAEIVGARPDDVRFDLESNVRAAAALLSALAADTLGHDYAEWAALGDWRDVLAAYSGLEDPEAALGWVEEVMERLRYGDGRVLENGEIVEFEGAGDAVDEMTVREG